MGDSDKECISAVARLLRLVRAFYADAEVMTAWGSADAYGQIHKEAAAVIHRFKMKLNRAYPEDRGLQGQADTAAREIAEGKYTSPDDPKLMARWIEYKDHILLLSKPNEKRFRPRPSKPSLH